MSSDDDTDPRTHFLDGLGPELRALYDGPPPEDAIPVDGRSVSTADFLEVLADQVAPSSDNRPRTFRHSEGMLAAAWRHTVFRQARAVLALIDAGLEVEAQANARSCIEHAVALCGLALAADSGELEVYLEQLSGEVGRHQEWQLDHLERSDAAAGGSNRVLLEETRRIRVTPGPLQSVRARFEQVSPGGHLYSVYSRLSESTHPGLGSAVPYLASVVLGGPLVVPATPGPVGWADTAALLCWSCWAAENAMLRFLDDSSDLVARQDELLTRVGLRFAQL